MRIYSDNSLSIGRTPLVQLRHIGAGSNIRLAGKVEGRNPAYSVKCRIGASMIWEAERTGALKKGMTVIEPTSGNTGIALAYVGAARGYDVVLVMPDTMSVERRKLMEAFGASFILTPGDKGMKGAIDEAERLAAENPDSYFLPDQFKNPANPQIHVETTGPEIWDDTDGAVDAIVAGVGTGGTITGISRYIKETKAKSILSIAVEPADSPVITQHLAGTAQTPGPHKIQGIGAGFVPDVLDVSLIDDVITVSNEEAIQYAQRLAREEGIISGISSGAAVAGALKAAERLDLADKLVVVILPDSGERYLSTDLFDG